MRWLLGVLITLLVLAAALLAFAPATFVLARIQSGSDGALSFEGARGTLWRGSADALFINGEAYGRLDWVLSPLPLLRSTVDADVRIDGPRGVGSGRIRRNRDELLLTGVDAVLPADVLAPLLASLGLLPRGELVVELEELRMAGRLPAALAGKTTWRAAAVSAPGAGTTSLGEIGVRFGMQPDRSLRGELSDAGGSLGVDGHFEVSWLGYVVDVVLTPRTPQVASALADVGQPVGAGDRLLAVEGRWLAPRARSQD